MGVPGQNIVLLLLAGLILGLLPSTIADRRGFRLITDIGAAVVSDTCRRVVDRNVARFYSGFSRSALAGFNTKERPGAGA